jgi:hypothetical protein
MNLINNKFWIRSHTFESSIVLVVFLLVAYSAINFYYVTFYTHHLDSSFLMEAITSLINVGHPLTGIGITFGEASKFFAAEPELICANDLKPSGILGDVFETHAYLWLLPIAFISKFTSPLVGFSIIGGTLYILPIFIVYIFLRVEGVSKVGAFSFSCLILFHPVIAYGIKADFYVDRLFIPFGLAYALLLYRMAKLNKTFYKERCNYLYLAIIFGLLGAMATERATLMIISFSFAYLILFGKNQLRIREFLYLLLMIILLASLLSFYFLVIYRQHPGTGNLTSLLQDIPNFIDRIYQQKYFLQTSEFVWINIILVGIFLFQHWKFAIIAIVAMAPNIMTTYGGAEKTGWSTHYHDMYFPFLVAAISIGFSKLWNNARTTGTKWIYIILMIIIIISFAYSTSIYRNSKSALFALVQFTVKGNQSSEMQSKLIGQKISSLIPKGVKVSTSEMFMPALYENRTLFFYPIGIEQADYVVLERVENSDSSYYYAGAISYIGKKNEIDGCLNQRLIRSGFDVNNPIMVNNFAILRKIKGE